ncbi:helix-turn-helix domain-containing protein [Pseudonocardia parietis]|uniref:DNA-binding XRE family transcriptional regulator/quercetin dioxygenase-like cupin family protein n=1 Tax=Pseudonocardia parietis TaxID=570936 RepID=A0ABS4VV75_9PSEU|nr:XRE family transcriptional regulator [Pseudonocardia parietis]MBP2367829.1 DNA-binding XRE family transcriptional regulator/quercetin dioxygenase-like cupin family protein [Pseudonocardia parietis]
MSGSATDADDHPATANDPGTGEADREAIVRSIGPKLYRLRQQGGLSLQQLARRADVSSAAIHKLEKGDMIPTVTTLLKLAAALDRPIGYFVDGDGDPVPVAHLVRGADRPPLPSLPGTTRAGLTGPPDRFALQGAVVEIAPGAALEVRARLAEDLLLVLAGTVEVTIAGEWYALDHDDSLHVPGGHRVHCHNPGPAVAVLTWVSTGDSGS